MERHNPEALKKALAMPLGFAVDPSGKIPESLGINASDCTT